MISLMFLTFNRLPMVMRCFRSLLPTLTERTDVEWIIHDNASSDGTAQWLTGFLSAVDQSRVKLTLGGINLGVSGGREHLLTQASGDYLVFLDSDVYAVHNQWIDQLLAPLAAADVGICGVGGHDVTLDTQGNWKWFQYHPQAGEVDVVAGFSQAFRRSLLDQGVAIDLNYGRFHHEDSDFCLQARALGHRVMCTGDVGLRHIHAGSGDDGTGQTKYQYLASKWQGKGLIKAERQ